MSRPSDQWRATVQRVVDAYNAIAPHLDDAITLEDSDKSFSAKRDELWAAVMALNIATRPRAEHHYQAVEILEGLIEVEMGPIHPVGQDDFGAVCICWYCRAKRFVGKPEGWVPA